MASLNKVLLMGNLTREPGVRYTNSGAAVCEFGLAINRRFSSNGQDREETCFVDIVVWGKQAESAGRYLEKGAPVFIEGRLQLDQWQDKETGANRSKLRVVAERVQFLGRGGDRGDDTDQQYDGGSSFGGQQQSYQQAPQQQQAPTQQPAFGQPQAFAGGQQQQGFRQAPQQQAAPAAQPQPAFGQPQAQQPPQQPPVPNEAFSTDDDMEDDIPF